MVRRRLVALVGVAAVLTAACGTASESTAPSGVDELVIPTPSVDPADFAGRIDNPWLPLAPGATWTYRVTGDAGSGTLTVTVRDERQTVAGVAATVVDTTAPDGTVRTDLYAQDRSGNVWWFGRVGVWQADEDGAEAGLAMPETPRIGDGWRQAYAAGVVEDRTTVLTLEGSATTPAGIFGDLAVLQTATDLDPDADRKTSYALGAGMVAQVATSGPSYTVSLVSAPGA